MEFATEEEMREILGGDAKGYNVGSGWKSVEEDNTVNVSVTKIPKKVFIGCYIGNGLMYLAAKGTTFIKACAKQFDDTESTDTKVRMMNKNGYYVWKKIPVA